MSGAIGLPLPNVLAFAEEQGVTSYLSAVLALTRRIFPMSPLTV